MRYRNTKTGAIIEVDSCISGGNWEPVEAPKPPISNKEAQKQEITDAPKKTVKKK